jgi:DNA-binding transcriptional ArsR family regulator
MEKEKFIELIDNGLSINQISETLGKAPTTISYWLKKFNLKTNNLSFKDKGIVDYEGKRCCPKCNETKPLSEFYNRRGKIGGSVYCKICTSKQSLDRQRALKQQAVDYKGGCCEKCGYSKYNGALEFHHLDPSKKDFNIGALKNYTFSSKIKEELDKCILVCANCHREIHGNV